MEELKPCPFCGNEEIKSCVFVNEHDCCGAEIMCKNCKADIDTGDKFDTEEEAAKYVVKLWNTRA